MAWFRCYDNSDVIATLINMTNFHLLWWQFFLMFVYDDVVYAQTWHLPWKTVSSHLHTPVRPMLLQYDPRFFSTLVKIWDTCENFLGKWFTAPPGKKFLVRLWLPPCRTSIKGNSWTQHEMETMKAPWSMSALPPYNKEICLEECTKEQIQSLPFPSLHQKCCGTLEGEFFCIL